jgi:hypothetical protein
MGFQRGAELGEARGELPVPEDRRVVERTGLVAQRRQIVDRVEDHHLFVRTSLVGRDGLPCRHDHHAIDVALDRHHLEGERPRHAVTVAVEGDGLVLVDHDRGADHAGVEPVRGQRHRRSEVFSEAVLDGEGAEERVHDPLPLGLTTVAEECVQFIEIGDTGDRGGEAALHGLDGPLGIGLLVSACRHAELGGEGVVAGQRGIARVELAITSLQDQRSYTSWIIPPDLLGNGVVELEGRDHAFEDGLGAFEGEGQHEGGVRVGPGRDQERHEPATFGEVDVDMAEIGFEPVTGKMPQRDERFLMPASVLT